MQTRGFVIAVSIAALAVVPGRAAPSVDRPTLVRIDLETLGAPIQAKGRPFAFAGIMTNLAPVALTGVVEVSVHPPEAGAPIELQGWIGTIQPGQSADFERTFNPARFAGPPGIYSVIVAGSFRLQPVGLLAVDEPTAVLDLTVLPPPVEPVTFEDITTSSGITTSLQATNCQNYAAGAAWGDVNGDALPDLYIPQRGVASELWINQGGTFVERAGAYGVRNDGPDGTFGIGIGATFVDYDNDGRLDLLVTNDGRVRLYHQEADGTFQDATTFAGLTVDGNFTSASWADYDADGFLDVFIASHGRRASCRDDFTEIRSRLYHNRGDGTFEDVTGILPSAGSTHGLAFIASWTDYNADGRIDLLLGNDHIERANGLNVLWRNDGPAPGGGWLFSDVSSTSGAGIGINTMGAGIGDPDRDGVLDVAHSNIGPLAFMRNNGDGTFTNSAAEAGLGRATNGTGNVSPITWALAMHDFNNDGWDDLYAAAGGLDRGDGGTGHLTPHPNEMFVNDGTGHFLDLSADRGADDPGASRGLATIDIDRDGRLDMLLINLEGPARLLRNMTPTDDHWIAIRAMTAGRDACGARVLAEWPGSALPIAREVSCGSTSSASGSDPTLHIGLGDRATVERLTIWWPSGEQEVYTEIAADRFLTLTQA